jgi:hypothetical protein
MPLAEGRIDVDRMQGWQLANRVVAARAAAWPPKKRLIANS